jgi:peptide/nickel transport system substrate-binding protein
MKRIGLRLVAGISLALAWTAGLCASTSPRYGGVLRIELQAVRVSLDPRGWKEGSTEAAREMKLAGLIFERLVDLDNYGRFQPVLATEWSHDAGFKRWQFTLRNSVRFSDGTALSAADVVAALQPLLTNGQQVSASAVGVVIQSSAAMPDLLEQLASGRYFVYRAQADGSLTGTGPFILDGPANAGGEKEALSLPAAETSSTRGAVKVLHLRFRANETTWSGRPFVDAVDVTLGALPLRALFDLQLGKADLVELPADLVRRATQENLRVWSSAPVTLYGLRFDDAQPAAGDGKLREALALALDRQTVASVLLQKQAEPASALLPQWLSGYAFLFTMETNPESAKGIRAKIAAKAIGAGEPLRLRVDAAGDLPKLLGERVAVNARQSSILIQLQNHAALRGGSNGSGDSEPAAGLHLFAWRYSSLSPRIELDAFVSAMQLAEGAGAVSSTDPEQLYARERHVLDERRILPLVAVPDFVGIGSNVRDWMPARWGAWRLADLWLEAPDTIPTITMPAGSPAAAAQAPNRTSGAKP